MNTDKNQILIWQPFFSPPASPKRQFVGSAGTPADHESETKDAPMLRHEVMESHECFVRIAKSSEEIRANLTRCNICNIPHYSSPMLHPSSPNPRSRPPGTGFCLDSMLHECCKPVAFCCGGCGSLQQPGFFRPFDQLPSRPAHHLLRQSAQLSDATK